MARTFYRKQFSNYLGEQRAIDDIVLFYTVDISPTPSPTPSITPSHTPTPSPTGTPIISVTSTPTSTPTNTPTPTTTLTSTPTGTPNVTSTPTQTSTPTGTPNPLCPQQLILSASTSGYLYGLYNRATIYTGGTFETAWYNFDDNVMNYGTNPDGNDYVAFSIQSGSDYTSLYWGSDIMGNDGYWYLGYSTGNTLFNGGTLISSIVLDTNSIVDGILFFPPSGNLQYNGGYVQYPASCPTPTPTATPTSTPSYVTWYLSATGATGYDVCSLPASTTYYSYPNAGSSPNAGEYIFLDSALTQPVPDNTYIRFNYSFPTIYVLIVNNGGLYNPGEISNIDPNFICVTQTPTPTNTTTPTPTSPTPTPTTTPTNTPTPTQTPAPSFDVDAAAYLNEVLLSGGTLSPTISAATNTLFVDLKANGLYSKIDVMYPMLGSNAGGVGIDAKNPVSSGYPIQWFGGMTFSDKGAIGNGSNGYGNTYYNTYVSSNPLNYGWGVYMYDDGNFGSEVYNSGAFDGTYISTMRGDTSSQVGCFGYNVGDARCALSIPGFADYTGSYSFTFDSSQLKSLYRNYDVASGTTCSTTMPGTPRLSNQPIMTHTLNINGSPYTGNYWSGTMSFYWIGESMTSSEVSTLSSIINTFQTSLGRNIY